MAGQTRVRGGGEAGKPGRQPGSSTRARLLACVALVLVFGVGGCTGRAPVVTILHFNDVYEIEPVEGGRAGGLARVAALRARLLETEAPVLTTLGGDYLSPSAIGTATVDGQPLAGRQMVDVLNAVGLDWATFGNHEFDVPEPAFRQRMSEQRFKLVSSNVTNPAGSAFEGVTRSAVLPIRAGGRDLRIGLIGLTIDSNRKPWVRYAPPIDSAKAEIAKLRASGRLDAIVALTHLALADDQALAAAVDDLDLILGGHEHENWLLRRGGRFTPIVKADANVRSVAVVTLTFGEGGRPTSSVRLEVIDSRLAPDPKVEALAAAWRTRAFDAFRRQGFSPEAAVATLPEPLDGRESTVRNRPGLLTDIITAAMLREVKDADLAIVNGGSVRIDDVLPPGPVTQYDVIRVLPFGGAVVRATFEGGLLAQVLDAGLKNQGSGGYLQTARVARANDRWEINGQPLVPTRRYAVALNDFLLTGGEANMAFLVRTNPRLSNIQAFRDIRQAVIEELRARYK